MLDSSDKVSALEDNVSKATTATSPTASLTISSNNGSGGTGGSGSGIGGTEFSNSGSSKSAIEITVDVIVEAELVENYKLQIASGNGSTTSNNPTALDGPSSINAINNSTNPNGVEVLADNTWGYKWNNTGNYKGITTSLVNLESANTSSTNGYKAFFTKPLTFAAKFADTATAGHYSAEVTLSLVATPKVFFEGISTMQAMTPEICEKAAIGDFAILRDDRSYPTATVTGKDGTSTTTQQISNTYTISKLPDGRCWMTQNLRLTGTNSSTTSITSVNSNISGNYNIPANNKSAFNASDTTQAAFLGTDDADNITGYYTWCAATAGTCASAPKANDIAPSSICPKGWRLPTGGRNYTNGSTSEFYNLIMNGILKDNSNISSWKNNVSSNHYFTSSDAINIIKGSPYNFAFTGNVNNSSYNAPASNPGGNWWSSTASSSSNAYALRIYGNSSYVYPGTNNNARYLGFAVRCVAEENAKWSNGTDSGIQYMQDIDKATTSGGFCSSSIPNNSTIKLKDSRDGNEYTITKMPDGKCWMTENLRIMNKSISSSDSNLAEGASFTIPASSTSGFSNDTASNAYLGADADGISTGYYTWCAATAGTCSSAPNANDIAPSSICPKGWRLPTGSRTYTEGNTSEFYNLIMNGILKDNGSIASWKNNVSSSHYFTSSDAVDAIKGSPYNFAFTGYVGSSSYNAPASSPYGYWWSSTAGSRTNAYDLNIYGNNSNVYPGTSLVSRRLGFAVRCVAE